MNGPDSLRPTRWLVGDVAELRRNWFLFLLLGAILILLGVIALMAPVVATAVAMKFFGWLLVFSGALQVVHAFWARRWGGFFLELVCGMLELLVGLFIVTHALPTAAAFTLVLAVFFIVTGVFRVAAAIGAPPEAWPWLLLSGLLNLVMGGLIWAEWPESGVVIIGIFVGIDLLFNGWWLVALSLAVRGQPQPSGAGSGGGQPAPSP